jgi:hypothetical protein
VAQKTIVTLEDDLDGGPAESTISFALDGTNYEIDLNGGNAGTLRDLLSPYVASARRVGRGSVRRAVAGVSARRAPGAQTNDIRDWARANGYTVNDRGRLSRDVVAAYEAAH